MSEQSTDAGFILSEFAARLSYSDLPDEVLSQIRLFIADYFASAYAGLAVNGEISELVAGLVISESTLGKSSIFGYQNKIPADQAAFINAFVAHGSDYDDGNKKAAGHIGAHVFSSIFALAEEQSASWKSIVEAIVVGYELFNRIAAAAQPGLYQRGFHSTGVVGAIASAAACAKLLGLGQKGIYSAISLGALQSSGLIIIDESAQEVKPLNAANAAKLGVLAAKMAQLGIAGPANALNHPEKGWFHAIAGQYSLTEITDKLGEDYTIVDSYLKLYPTCRHTHCVIDAALDLRRMINCKNGSISSEDIQHVIIRIYPSAIRSAGSISMPNNQQEAKFSLAYAFAVAFCTGGFSLEDLKPSINPEVSDLALKVTLVKDESMEDRSRGIRGACVIVNTIGGDHKVIVPVPRGERGGGMLGWNDMRRKMECCCRGQIDPKEVNVLVDYFMTLDFANDYEASLLFGRKNSVEEFE